MLLQSKIRQTRTAVPIGVVQASGTFRKTASLASGCLGLKTFGRGVRGYHILKPEHLLYWLGPAIFEVEARGSVIWQDDKGVAEQARLVRRLDTWNKQTARLFACDRAEAVVHLTKDKRCDDAIRIARRFAFGLATKEELAAARNEARNAEHDAVTNIAEIAARAAAWGTESARAKAAQTRRLFQYLRREVDLEAIRRSVE